MLWLPVPCYPKGSVGADTSAACRSCALQRSAGRPNLPQGLLIMRIHPSLPCETWQQKQSKHSEANDVITIVCNFGYAAQHTVTGSGGATARECPGLQLQC